MENKKSLQINTSLCDTRAVTEEILSAYGSIKINAATIITSPASQALLGKYNAKLNCATVQALDENTRITVFNGNRTISPAAAVPEENTFLTLNGSLDIEPGSEEVLKNYTGIIVNGIVTCPRSLQDRLSGKLTVNGILNTYPDGCIPLKDTTILDRFFHLRAKQDAVYYAAKRVIALAPDINFAKLAEKNVRFETEKLLVTESLAETATPFFSDRTDVTVFPDGCAYVDGDAVLDESLLRRYGGSLYVTGDLTIPAKSAPLLDQITFLRIDGDLLAARSLKDKVLSMDIKYGELYIVGGTLLSGAASGRINAYMLEHAEDGLSILGYGSVSIDADVSPELLCEKVVSIIGCASVTCATEEQRSVLSPLAKGVASISLEDQEGRKKDENEDENTVTFNSAFYTF